MRVLLASVLLSMFAFSAQASNASLLGVYTTDNVPSLTMGFTDQFGNFTYPQLSMKGSATNTTIVQPPSSGGGTITLPQGTGVLALATGNTPVVCGATCTVTSANSNGKILLSAASGSVATLPAATGTGNVYTFFVTTTTTSGTDKILAASSSDAIVGLAIGENAGTAKVFSGNASTYHSLQMPFSGSQPSGGFNGDYYTCTDVATNVWNCSGTYQAGTTPTTPYSASTS